MHTIDRQQVESMLAERPDVALLEALPEESFREFHVPGAINVPVNDYRFERKVMEAVPYKDTPIIVYCLDASCDASPRAAEHLEALGYREVYTYRAGKTDWKNAGNPLEA